MQPGPLLGRKFRVCCMDLALHPWIDYVFHAKMQRWTHQKARAAHLFLQFFSNSVLLSGHELWVSGSNEDRMPLANLRPSSDGDALDYSAVLALPSQCAVHSALGA